MNWSPVLPAVTAVVAAAVALTRRIPTLVLESPIGIPGPGALTRYTLGGHFVGFVLVYGLLLGVAYRVGRGGDALDVGATTLATGVVGAVVYLVVSGAVLLWAGPEQGLLVAVGAVGSAAGVGVELAVVGVGGLALGRWGINR